MANKIKNILVSGSLAFDRIMDFPGKFSDHILPDKIHNLNVAFNINELRENFGGCAGNIAYNLALLNERPFILATAGTDFGSYKKWLKKKKVDISQVKEIKEKHTASAYIITDKADNQITGFNMGAMNVARGKEVFKGFSAKALKNSLAIVSPGNIDDMREYGGYYKKANIRYIFDPGQAIPALKSEVIKRAAEAAEILIGNDYEVEMIKKKTGWTSKQLIDKVRTLIITKGELGSEIFIKGRRIKVRPVKAKELKDPTGAGDAYRAGLLKGLASGWDMEKSAKLASVVASYAVEKYGTQNHAFTWKSVAGKFLQAYNEKL
ncbi:MAG: carbohydrate kinase family protein [Patescibacteria group bacterium]|jgi:adenosine kinase